MRLLNTKTRKLEDFMSHDIPPYAILSHTWAKDEVSFQDMQASTVTEKEGYAKIQQSCERALQDGLNYVWVDTCCIDKASSAELSEALNSMMTWYAQSQICYAHLADVPPITDYGLDEAAFRGSRWFTRGWTLQELIAPSKLVFLAQDWSLLFPRDAVAERINDITGISHLFLETRPNNQALKFNLMSTSIAERMSWASTRETSRTEDIAYSLLGIFQVNMPLLYGEGSNAFRRLQEEIIKRSDDQSLFAWGFGTPDHDLSHKRSWSRSQSMLEEIVFFFKGDSTPQESTGAMKFQLSDTAGILAESPAAFRGCGDIVPCDAKKPTPPFAMTNKGLSIELPVLQLRDGCFALLQCQTKTDPTRLIALPLLKIEDTYCRSQRGNYVADHAAWFTWPRAQLFFFLDEESTLAGIMNYPRYSVVIRTHPPNFRIAQVLPASPSRRPGSRVIFTKPRQGFDLGAEEVFVQFCHTADRGLSFFLAVYMEETSSWSPDAKWGDTLTPCLFLPPSKNNSPTVQDLQHSSRQQRLATNPPAIPYSVEITTQSMTRSGLYMIDIIPEARARKVKGIEIHHLRFWTDLLHRAVQRDTLVGRVYESWLDYLCDRGSRIFRLLTLSPSFFTFPFDLLATLFVSLAMRVVSHIGSYRECLTATSYDECLENIVHKFWQTAMAYKINVTAVVSASYLLLSNPSAMRRIWIGVLKCYRSRGVRGLLLLYMICKCIPSKTLLSLAGEEDGSDED
ncbi:hypothetical protein AbraIFM66951_010555 [Aspergillus brasiliensis]|uniref:Heterokaryon incompatibility domain-containing protein n=1 Tax=Aspergillus brasiliensis TaxID=319629 RepID=A0A9W5YXM3_9EURO|nr:hypothetical protein AbraCBS73388_010670 [Aspergillus brasiliensis]GKZ47204.1 hypothetical protein AbraIFM66951_010555 [Aspergillus brasiliensis]